MKYSFFFDYIKKVIKSIKSLAEETGYSSFRLMIDYLWAALRHGTLIRQYTIGEFWKKSDLERKKCLTYPRMVRYMNKYNDCKYIHYLNDKYQFNCYFQKFVRRDWLYVNNADESEFKSFLDRNHTVIVKPLTGVEGGGIQKLYSNEIKDIHLLYEQLRSDNVLVEQFIIQHPRMAFGNSSVNTIRTMTILDRNGRGHVVKAMLRAGVGDNVVDNYAQGGSIYEVDVASGVVNSYGKSKAGGVHLCHPGTDIIMLGYRIPNWEQVVEMSEKAAEYLPQVRIVGWDVAITIDGVQMIEGNHNPDYELYEYIGTTGYNEIFKSLL